MQYYHLTNSTEIEDIGYYPQTIINKGAQRFEEIPDFEKNFIENGSIEINKRSKPTNLLDRSSVSRGLIVDVRLKELLSEFKLPAHQFHKIPTKQRKEELDYYWLTFPPADRHVDFEKSEFEILRMPKLKVIGKIKLTSVDFFQRIVKALTFEEKERISSLFLKETFPKQDLICFKKVYHGIFISEKLHNKFIEEGISGIQVSKCEVITLHNK